MAVLLHGGELVLQRAVENGGKQLLLCYPHGKKAGYEAVKSALRPVMPSARISKFDWTEEELFNAELWLLNDSQESVEDVVTASLEWDDNSVELLVWKTGICHANANKQGHRVQFRLPHTENGTFTLRLVSSHGVSEYHLPCRTKDNAVRPKILNL